MKTKNKHSLRISSSRREEMKGIVNAYCRQIKEGISIVNALQEPIDNSLDAPDTHNIDVTVNTEANSITFHDDGIGMSDEAMQKFVTNFTCHMPQKGQHTIGIRGVGMKNAIIRLGDFGTEESPVARAAIVTSPDGEHFNRARFTLSKNEKLLCMPEVDYNFTDSHKQRGTTVSISPCVALGRSLSSLARNVAEAYSHIIETRGIQITINGHKLQAKDHMYLSVLGKDINNEGVYLKDGLIFNVKEYELVKRTNAHDKRHVKCVYLFITKDKNERRLGPIDDDRPFEYGGLYTIKGGRYIDHGTKIATKNRKDITSSRGGTGRSRLLIILDDNEDIFGVKGNKGRGIENMAINPALNAYFVIGYDKELAFGDIVMSDFQQLTKLVNYENSKLGPTKRHRTITQEVAETIFSGKISKPKKSALDIAVTPASISSKEMKKMLLEIEESDKRRKERRGTIHKVVRCTKNIETGATEYCFTEYMPSSVNKELMTIVTDAMIEAHVPAKKIEMVCASLVGKL